MMSRGHDRNWRFDGWRARGSSMVPVRQCAARARPDGDGRLDGADEFPAASCDCDWKPNEAKTAGLRRKGQGVDSGCHP